MAIIEKLATSMGRRDEKPNQELAALLASKNDQKAVMKRRLTFIFSPYKV